MPGHWLHRRHTNLAARLQALARRGEVVVGPETTRALAGRIRLSPSSQISIRGRNQPIEAFMLRGLLVGDVALY